MITRKQFDAYARRNMTIDANVKKAIDHIWSQLDTSDMESLLLDLSLYLPLVAEKFGAVAAVAAAEFYDESRAASKAKGRYRATTAKGALWKVDRDVKYAASGSFAYADVKAFLTETVQGVVRDYGRQTIAENSRMDAWSDGYCSVPTSDNPCAFCIIKALGSPGGMRKYHDEVLRDEVFEDAWHDNCSCILQPTWEESPYWLDGQYDDYWDMYMAGRAQAHEDAGTTPMTSGLTARQVMAGMRKANGIGH